MGTDGDAAALQDPAHDRAAGRVERDALRLGGDPVEQQRLHEGLAEIAPHRAQDPLALVRRKLRHHRREVAAGASMAAQTRRDAGPEPAAKAHRDLERQSPREQVHAAQRAIFQPEAHARRAGRPGYGVAAGRLNHAGTVAGRSSRAFATSSARFWRYRLRNVA